jgi:hypothetical protein
VRKGDEGVGERQKRKRYMMKEAEREREMRGVGKQKRVI